MSADDSPPDAGEKNDAPDPFESDAPRSKAKLATTQGTASRKSFSPPTTAECWAIAESIVGEVDWLGTYGFCTCPGILLHTKRNSSGDCKVITARVGDVAPGIYCFHDSCGQVREEASFRLRSALGKRSPSTGNISTPIRRPLPRHVPTFDPATLERIARKLDGADAAWFAARSPRQPDNRTPASFLHDLYGVGEKVVIFDVFESQGQGLWTCDPYPYDARELDSFRRGKPNGVWFLANPVSGEYLQNGVNRDGSPHYSRRFEGVITSWRYLVLESDKANPEHWLAVLAQLPLPIAAVYTSGGDSIHALVRIDAESKKEWDDIRNRMLPILIQLGADRKTLSAVRLTRLPMCERVETGRMQTLLYLDPNPTDTPIADMPVLVPGSFTWTPADQDGFDMGGNQ